jgi:hypothetical protein
MIASASAGGIAARLWRRLVSVESAANHSSSSDEPGRMVANFLYGTSPTNIQLNAP